jgi:DNA-binding NtrC family response regulator
MQNKRILIFDEWSFARVCSVLLQNAGYEAETFSIADDVPSARDIRRFGLFITSYPFCAPLFEEIRKFDISTIILSDDIDENLFTILKDFNNSYCMMKPLDYEKFRSLVRKVMSRKKTAHGGSRYLV